MEEIKYLSYDKTLRPHVGEDAIFSFLKVENSRATVEKIEGKISKGPLYYSIHGDRGIITLIPGFQGQIEVGGKTYKLSDLVL